MTEKTKTMCCIIGSRSLAGLAVCKKKAAVLQSDCFGQGGSQVSLHLTREMFGHVARRKPLSLQQAHMAVVHAVAVFNVESVRIWSSPASAHRSDQ